MLGNFGNIKNKYNLEEEDVYKKFETYAISKLDISRMYRYLDYLCKCHNYHENWITNIPNKIILDGKMRTEDLPIHEFITLN